MAADELCELGSLLRRQIEASGIEPDLLRAGLAALREGGPDAARQLAAGFGPGVEDAAVAATGFALLSQALDRGAIGRAARDSADFVRLMRAVGAQRAAGALQRLKRGLLDAALAAGASRGASREDIESLVRPLVEA
jgi:hypothetical protein